MGTRLRLEPGDDGLITRILRTRRVQRVDDYAALDGPSLARDSFGIRSSVGAPIVVEGRVWGILGVTGADAPLPPLTEQRLEQFAELAAAAVATAHSRMQLRRLADEQAALRRVAELVAIEGAPQHVFDAVVQEAANLLGEASTALSRYEPGGGAVILAVCRNPLDLVGTHVPTEGRTCHGEVWRTGRAFRLSTFKGTPLEETARRLGVGTAVGVPIFVAGRVWGVLTTSLADRPPPADTEERLAQFTGLVGTAIANAESRSQLTASRARVIAAADESRRHLQRDVHDGAQQRLVQTVITLKLAKLALERGEPSAALVDEALQHAERAGAELRDLVRGILPSAVSRGDLRAAVDGLLNDFPLPAEVMVDVPRLTPEIAVTAYFVVAEAMTNVVKHAGASRVVVSARRTGATFVVEVADDGVGGADALAGSGLTGLCDRVAASAGTLELTSPEGAGTTLRVQLPLDG